MVMVIRPVIHSDAESNIKFLWRFTDLRRSQIVWYNKIHAAWVATENHRSNIQLAIPENPRMIVGCLLWLAALLILHQELKRLKSFHHIFGGLWQGDTFWFWYTQQSQLTYQCQTTWILEPLVDLLFATMRLRLIAYSHLTQQVVAV